jgi:phosphotriesterase-related protein
MPHVMTVRGPVEPDEIGPTLTHEHIFMDARHAWDPSELPDPSLGAEPFRAELGGLARWSWKAFRDALHQSPDTDYAMIAEEVAEFPRAGGSCIVELTNVGIAPAPAALRRISEELDVHVVAGSGWYVHPTHPPDVESADVDALTERLAADVEHGLDDTDVRPGIIGELGTSEQLEPCEERVLRAGARVARRTGLAINIHCHPPELAVVMRILDVLEEEGHDLARTSLSHLDEIGDPDYHEAVLRRGVIVGFDSFGHDGGYFSPSWRARSDLDKMATLAALVERGWGDQLVVSQDMHRKHFLLRFGGLGYNHVLLRIVPRLRSVFGVDDATIDKLLVTTPRRLLTIDRPSEG